MRRQNPWANTTVSRASGGPTSRTASGTPSGVVTTALLVGAVPVLVAVIGLALLLSPRFLPSRGS